MFLRECLREWPAFPVVKYSGGNEVSLLRSPHHSPTTFLMSKQNIVIVGGGGAGVNAANALSRSLDASKYQLILINPLPYRVWLIATLRLTVSPQEGLKEEMMLPYDKVFAKGNGKFVEGTVASFEASKEGASGGTVTLESGEKIECVAFRFFFYFFGLRAHVEVDFLVTIFCSWPRVQRGVALRASLVPKTA